MKDRIIKLDAREMDVSEIIETVLMNRGIEDINHFLYPTEDDLIPFEQMIGLKDAAQVVLDTLDEDGSILIYADTDVDGVCAATIIYEYLTWFSNNIQTTINEGKRHGIAETDIRAFDGFDTVIIVDSIDNDPSAYKRLTDAGINVIILDHHIIPTQIKEANLPIHLVSSANNYPNPALSGAGVALKFCLYLDYLTLNDYADDLYDLAACGIIADMCDVSETSYENRYICDKGFRNYHSLPIVMLCGNYDYNAQAVSFGIAPYVNAAMRTKNNDKALELFVCGDTKICHDLYQELKTYRESQNQVVKEIEDTLMKQANFQLDNNCIFFFTEKLDAEVSGLIANRMLEKFKRPVLVLTRYVEIDESTGEVLIDEFRGSARALGMRSFKDHLEELGIGNFAGHENAFGCFIPADEIEDFMLIVNESLEDEVFSETIECDVWMKPEQLTKAFIEALNRVNAVSGEGFPPIGVYLSGFDTYSVSTMSEGKHLRFTTPDITIIKWNSDLEFESGVKFDAYGQPNINIFRGRESLQLIANELFT